MSSRLRSSSRIRFDFCVSEMCRDMELRTVISIAILHWATVFLVSSFSTFSCATSLSRSVAAPEVTFSDSPDITDFVATGCFRSDAWSPAANCPPIPTSCGRCCTIVIPSPIVGLLSFYPPCLHVRSEKVSSSCQIFSAGSRVPRQATPGPARSRAPERAPPPPFPPSPSPTARSD